MHYEQVRKTFQGELWTQSEAWGGKWFEGLKVIQSSSGTGLSKDRRIIHQGSNSGYQAINLAYHFGATTILLLGYDMQGVGDHWFGKHQGLPSETNYAGLVEKFASIKPADYGIEIINCTRSTALHCFPRMTIDEAIATNVVSQAARRGSS